MATKVVQVYLPEETMTKLDEYGRKQGHLSMSAAARALLMRALNDDEGT